MTNRTSYKIVVLRLGMLLCLLLFWAAFCLAIYGGVQLYTCSARHQQLEDYRYIINDQKIRIAHLRDLNDYTAILEQLLTPLQLAELKVLSEMIKQKKYKEFERIEQPLIEKK
ncbi:hypothetical protein KAX02_02780 [candidate division WOR-3 bacterium]|nr:hypothetical protein [candidate division WOR-3 bacterium]